MRKNLIEIFQEVLETTSTTTKVEETKRRERIEKKEQSGDVSPPF